MTFTNYLHSMHTQETVKSYTYIINHFLLHSKGKENSSYTDIIDYLAEYNFQSQRIIAGLKKYFDFLYEEGYRTDHPCKHLSIQEQPKAIQFQELFTPDELEVLLKQNARYPKIRMRNKCIVSLLIYQALTPANIVNLRTEDVDVDTGTVYIRSTPNINRRTLELKSKQMPLFMNYIHRDRPQLEQEKSKALFIGMRGDPYSQDAIKRLLLPMKQLFPTKNLMSKSIRKSVIANWLNVSKMPLDQVQLLSGQQWIGTTERYIRPDMEEKRGKINEFWAL